jgi:hypothetical protein
MTKPRTMKANRIAWATCALVAGVVLVGGLVNYGMWTIHVQAFWLPRQYWHVGKEREIPMEPGVPDAVVGLNGTFFELGPLYVFVPDDRTGSTP